MTRRLTLAGLAFALSCALSGQAFAAGILLIDRQKVLSESGPAQQLRLTEQSRRVALRAQLDVIQRELEAEEAEISALRGQISPEAFAERVKGFDTHVREARRRSQLLGEELQSEFEKARRDLAAALGPVLLDLLAKHDADVIVDVRSVLAARPGLDVTAEAIVALNAATARLFIAPESTAD